MSLWGGQSCGKIYAYTGKQMVKRKTAQNRQRERDGGSAQQQQNREKNIYIKHRRNNRIDNNREKGERAAVNCLYKQV